MGRKNIIISTDAEKAFDITQYHFMANVLNKLGTKGNFLQMLRVSRDTSCTPS